MRVNLKNGGATIRVWAPAADDVYVLLNPSSSYVPNPGDRLFADPSSGYWSGFLAGCNEGARVKFWIKGKGSSGFKRDPYARELSSPSGGEGQVTPASGLLSHGKAERNSAKHCVDPAS